jgi:hypothetical protein
LIEHEQEKEEATRVDPTGDTDDSRTASSHELDPGIRDVVDLLQSWEFETTDSGDGVSKLAAGWSPDEVMSVPHVHMRVRSVSLVEKARLLLGLLRNNGVIVGACGEGEAYIQASYDPADDSGVLSLYGLDDERLHAQWLPPDLRPAAGRESDARPPDEEPRAGE